MKYKLVDLQTAINKIGDGPIAFDTETDGFYGKIVLAQFYQKGWEEVLMVHAPNAYELLGYLSKIDNTLVMHRALYDITTVQRQTGAPYIPNDFDDTLLLARIAWAGLKKFALDELLTVMLKRDPYKEQGISKKDMHKATWKTTVLPSPDQLTYAAIDVWYLLDLYEAVLSAKESFSYKLDMKFLDRCLVFQRNGMYVDQERVEAKLESNLALIEQYNMPINVNSYKQVRPYIGSDNSDALGLATLALKGNEKAANVRTVRQLIKQNSFLHKYITPDGFIYGAFGPYARSGRATCDQDNLQQLPRKTKDCFGAEPGRRMLYSDYSQLELRSITSITGDQHMTETYVNNGDIHNLVRDMLLIDRQIAKTVNFNALYGGGVNMLQGILIKDADLLLPHTEVSKILKKWKNLFRGIAAWQEKGIRDYNAGRLGRTACGRQYIGNLMTDQLNIENQGTGSEVAKLAMHYMFDDLLDLDCNITNFVHDSYILDTPDDDEVSSKASKIMADAMQEAWFSVISELKVPNLPMPVTVRGGYNWGDIEADKFVFEYIQE